MTTCQLGPWAREGINLSTTPHRCSARCRNCSSCRAIPGGGLQAGSLFVHVQLEIEANAALVENLGNAFEKPIDLLWQRVQTQYPDNQVLAAGIGNFAVDLLTFAKGDAGVDLLLQQEQEQVFGACRFVTPFERVDDDFRARAKTLSDTPASAI